MIDLGRSPRCPRCLLQTAYPQDLKIPRGACGKSLGQLWFGFRGIMKLLKRWRLLYGPRWRFHGRQVAIIR